jgi:hypothetical protein
MCITARTQPSSYCLKGRTPAQALMEALAVIEIQTSSLAEQVIQPLPTAA